MSAINSEEVISILKTEIENFDLEFKEHEVGTVIWVGDGIATIYGIEHAMYGEIVIFENGVKGMVQDIQRDQIGCIILGRDNGIKEGTKVTRTKKMAGIPVGEAYLGRIVDALGAPIDGKGPIAAKDTLPDTCPAIHPSLAGSSPAPLPRRSCQHYRNILPPPRTTPYSGLRPWHPAGNCSIGSARSCRDTLSTIPCNWKKPISRKS